MAGTVVVDTVKSSTTSAPTFQNTSGTQMGTLCRAWVNFTGSTGAINAGFNVGSITRSSTGVYTINFTNAMPDANYCICQATDYTLSGAQYHYEVVNASPTSSGFSINCAQIANGGNVTDPNNVRYAVFR